MLIGTLAGAAATAPVQRQHVRQSGLVIISERRMLLLLLRALYRIINTLTSVNRH
jgi:hypothetical protein